LAAAVAVVDQATLMNWSPIMDLLPHGVGQEAGKDQPCAADNRPL
jgi:hypothetical protein